MTPLFDWLSAHPGLVTLLVACSIATFVVSLVALPMLVARLPADYFEHPLAPRAAWRDEHPLLVAFLVGAKNVLGAVLVFTGLVLLVLPGQGLLTMLAGLVLLDLPGKRAFERRVVARPRVLAALNWLRKRAGREPLRQPI